MFSRKIIYSLILFLLVLTLVLGWIIYYSQSSKNLKVIFLDVGQGDAILIEQGNQQMLIDGGRNGRLLMEKLGKYIPFWDRQIEVVVETHPDADHIGGLLDVFKNYEIKKVIKTKAESDSQTFKTLEESIRSEDSENVEAMKGVKISLADNAFAEVVYPYGPILNSKADNTNENSVSIVLNYGENKFFLGGDLPAEQEDSLNLGKINFLKVSHHGSKYSTSEKFLEMIKPDEAIISVGKNNTYGHPAEEILERLKQDNIKVSRTDDSGDIEYDCLPSEQKCQLVANN
jgi:competence protein ComEC